MFCSKVWWCWSKTWKWFLDHHPRLPEPRQEKWPQLAPTDNYFLSFFSAISSWQSTPHWTKHVGIYLAWALGFSLLMEISALDSGTSSTTLCPGMPTCMGKGRCEQTTTWQCATGKRLVTVERVVWWCHDSWKSWIHWIQRFECQFHGYFPTVGHHRNIES